MLENTSTMPYIAGSLFGLALGLIVSFVIIANNTSFFGLTSSYQPSSPYEREGYLARQNMIRKIENDNQNAQNKNVAHSLILSVWAFKLKDMPATKERDIFATNIINAIEGDDVSDEEYNALKAEFEALESKPIN